MDKKNISHRQRIEICISGRKPDRVPVSLWRHFPADDQSHFGLAAAITNFQNTYDYDFIKVTPASSYCIKDWGVEDLWRGNPEGTRDYTKRVIFQPEDWEKLSLLNPKNGYLGYQLECIKLLIKEFSPQTPIIQTIFSPMAQAKNLVGGDLLLAHMRQFPDALHIGLEKITETIIAFIGELIKNNIDGIFYALQHAQYNLLSENEFRTFCKPYDLRILQTANQFWLNLLHLHGEKVMFDEVIDYPVNIINWHDQSTTPSLREGKQKFKGVVCGGLRQWDTMALGTSERVREEARNAIVETEGTRFILGTGCVTPIITPHGNFQAARQIVTEGF